MFSNESIPLVSQLSPLNVVPIPTPHGSLDSRLSTLDYLVNENFRLIPKSAFTVG